MALGVTVPTITCEDLSLEIGDLLEIEITAIKRKKAEKDERCADQD